MKLVADDDDDHATECFVATADELSAHQRHFYAVAAFLCSHGRVVVVVHMLALVVAMSGLVRADVCDDVRDYGPRVSRSVAEIAVGKEFFGMRDELVMIPFVIMADDGGDLMREGYLA